MAVAVLPPTVHPLQPPQGSDIDFGAQIEGVDLENLTGLSLLPQKLLIEAKFYR
jgi:hypothetical protein